MITKKELTIGGRPFHFEFGELAPQAGSAVLCQYGETVVLAAVTVSKRETSLPYFPLSVDYTEKLYAAGKIKGSRWVKRDGRPSDELVLKGRIIDRSIRPLFPKNFKRDVQVIVSVLSVDGVNEPDMVGLIAVSAALSLSQAPWNGPIAGIRIGTDGDDLVVNPTLEQMEKSDLDLVVSGSSDKVVMIESGANQLPEERMIKAIEMAQKEMKPIVETIEELAKKHGKKKYETPEHSIDELVKKIEKSHKKQILPVVKARILKEDGAEEKQAELFDEIKAKYVEEEYEESDIMDAIDTIFKYDMRDQIMKKETRVDGRGLKDIRPLSGRVPVLPRTHGSALFNRGDTQALTITTLGSPSLGLLQESVNGESTKHYMHHYIMPPYSVGETGRFGFPSRREIGHGALAERALYPVIPSQEEFPYTIHLVSEILSSNGSTSMASTCCSTLSLMDAGVPIKAPVAGISVGLVTKGEDYKLITDIMGVEDFTGDMDFKVAGTKDGITAIQLDIKIDGLTLDIVRDTIAQAHEARMQILDVITGIIEKPRENLSQYAPKIESIVIPVEKIGEIIGPGGKNIKKIIAETGCEVNVEDDGTVTFANDDMEKVERAKKWVHDMVRQVEKDEVFEDATVVKLMSFGAFVEILPGKEGLVHLSQMSTEFVEKPEDVVKEGMKVKVRVREVDDQGRINLSMLFGKDAEAKRNSGGGSRGGSRSGGNGGSNGGRSGGNGGNRHHSGGGRSDRRYDNRNKPYRPNDKKSNKEPYKHPHLEDQN